MSANSLDSSSWDEIELQPYNLGELSEGERNSIIVNAIQVDGRWIILSRYGDDIWQLGGFTSNVSECQRRLNFNRVPAPFQAVMKAMLYRYLRRGRAGQRRPKGATLSSFFSNSQIFLRHIKSLQIESFKQVTPAVCTNYIAACRELRQTYRHHGKLLSQGALLGRFAIVETIYELSQFTSDPIPHHPWPDTSAAALAGLIGSSAHRSLSCTTPLIPDDIFCKIFESAYELIQQGQLLLDLRDTLDVIAYERHNLTKNAITIAKSLHLKRNGWLGGCREFNTKLLKLRTACYIILASTSGCRNHELANLEIGAHRRTEDDEGTIYHWMHSRSEKTDAGLHRWMIPEAGVKTLRLMERWAEPYQTMIVLEISKLKKNNRYDPLITKLEPHRNALFLGEKDGKARTLSCIAWGPHLKAFVTDLGLDWCLSSHQFRRKFANYVAYSKFGDLRYLREHFAHWTIDMSLGYAMDPNWGQHLDLELFDDIQTELQDIKVGVVNTWFDNKTLAGGYGRSLKGWQRTPSNLAIFKSHAAMVASVAESTSIRSNGHAWCTADDNRCIGNTLERTRCANCDNAVIGPVHIEVYQQQYDNLKGLLSNSSIGESGRQRVLRNMARSREVLVQLGYDPLANGA